jgi:hypothetical protein
LTGGILAAARLHAASPPRLERTQPTAVFSLEDGSEIVVAGIVIDAAAEPEIRRWLAAGETEPRLGGTRDRHGRALGDLVRGGI